MELDLLNCISENSRKKIKLTIINFIYISFQVAWMHFEQSAILTVHNHVITRNPRISVTHDKHDKHKTWFLHISNVQEEDKGRYMCQINTVTAKTQIGYLHVVGKFYVVIIIIIIVIYPFPIILYHALFFSCVFSIYLYILTWSGQSIYIAVYS